MGKGYLKVQTVTVNGAILLGDVLITITNEDNDVLYDFLTDKTGGSAEVELEAPDKWCIEDPYTSQRPYEMYNLLARACGYTTVVYEGVMIFDTTTSIIKIEMDPIPMSGEEDVKRMYIGGHKLYEIKAEQQVEQEQVILPRMLPEVTIPNFIRVHLNRAEILSTIVSVPFIDYIKNVATHEVYDGWTEQALISNIYCIVSLTLNRIYTEFYRKRGYNFDITSETYIDQKYVHGGIVGGRISAIVDRIFNNYFAVTEHKEPFLSLYNDGIKVSIPGRLSQWGSFYDVRDRSINAWQIIKKYYSQNLELRVCDRFGGVLESYPGYTLTQGTSRDAVRTMQLYLNRILGRYTNVIINPVDGIFGPSTRTSILLFQQLYNLPQTGEIDVRTWYEISRIYTIEKALWELYSEGKHIGIGTTPRTKILRLNDQGSLVVELQFLLDFIAMYHTEIPFVAQTSRFDTLTQEGVRAFQRLFALTVDGIVGAATWRLLYDVYWGIVNNGVPPQPPPPTESPLDIPPFQGTSLTVDSTGKQVRFVQQAINKLAEVQPGLWRIAEDGIFRQGTRDSVMAFQRIFGLVVDGIVGLNTWIRLMEESHSISTVPPLTVPPFPGNLSIGSTGDNVRLVQQAINIIAPCHPRGLWILTVDGNFGNMTRDAIFSFQSVFGMSITGVINQITWDSLMQEAANVSANGYGRGWTPPTISPFPGNLSVGSTGNNVRMVQQAINTIEPYHPEKLWILTVDGNFGNMTRDAIFSFQSVIGIPITGVVNQATWDRLMQEAANVSANGCGCGGTLTIPPFLGNLSVRSTGNNVRLVQQAINTIALCHPGRLWTLNVDGNFGNMTRDAIFSFQSVFGMPITGVVNQAAWDRLMQESAKAGCELCSARE